MKKTCLLIFFIFLMVFSGCKKNENSETTENVAKNFWKIEKENSQIVKIKWKQFENDSVRLKIPYGWKVKFSKDAWLYFPSASDNNKLYYSVIKYDVAKINMNSRDYIIEAFKQVSDKIDNFHYILKEVSFKNNTHCYILTIFSEEKGVNYVTYDLVYQPENLLYDFTFKTIDDKDFNEINYRQFLLILQSFEYNNENIIDGSKFIIDKERELKFEEL